MLYLKILLQIVFRIWFLYPALYWVGNNIHAWVSSIQLWPGWFDSIGNKITVDSYTLSHHAPSNFMLVFKRLHMNLLIIVTLLTLKVILGYHCTRLKTRLNIIKYKLSKSNLKETGILLSQLFVAYLKLPFLDYSSAILACLYCQAKTNGKKITRGGSTKKSPWLGRTHHYLSIDQRN